MDPVNRTVAMQMMIGAARAANETQFIFITPGAMAGIPNNAPDVRILRIADPERGQGRLSFNS